MGPFGDGRETGPDQDTRFAERHPVPETIGA